MIQAATASPADVVDDACAFAWLRFMRYQPARDRKWPAKRLAELEEDPPRWLVQVIGRGPAMTPSLRPFSRP